MDVAAHFRTIWNQRRTVLATALATMIVVFIWRHSQPKVYEAQTRLRVSPAASDTGTRPTGNDAVFIAEGYVERARSTDVLAAAGERSGLSLDANQVRNRVSIVADANAPTITVTATERTGAGAADLSDGVASALVTAVASDQQQAADATLAGLQAELTQLTADLAALAPNAPERAAVQARHDALVAATAQQQLRVGDQLTVMSPGDPTSDPTAPRPLQESLLAFLVALVVSAELVVAVKALRERGSRNRVGDDVAADTGLPILAIVRPGSGADEHEAFRELRTNLALMTQSPEAQRAIAVIGVDAGVGATNASIELALAAAAGRRLVVLVDGDLRRPELHDRLDVALSPGLSDVLGGAVFAPMPLSSTDGRPPLYVLPAGRPVDDPAMALSEQFSDRVLDRAAEQGWLTVVDAPPLTQGVAGAVIASRCDTTLLVVARSSSRQLVRRAVDRLRQVGVVPAGIVVTVERRAPGPSDEAKAIPEPFAPPSESEVRVDVGS